MEKELISPKQAECDSYDANALEVLSQLKSPKCNNIFILTKSSYTA